MGKRAVIREVVRCLQDRLDRMLAAGKSAEAYAKDEESRPEDKYDTRSLEASYLAAGQAKQAGETADAIRVLKEWSPDDFEEATGIGLGALVEAEVEGKVVFFLLAPAGGGTCIRHLGCDLTVLTLDSPLARRMAGLAAGDSLDGGRITIFGVE